MVDPVKALRRSKSKALTLLTARLRLPTREVCDTLAGPNLERMTLPGFDDPTPACA